MGVRSAMFAILLYFLVAFHFVSAGPLVQQDNVLAPNDHVLVQQHEDSVQLDDVLALEDNGLVLEATVEEHQNISARSGCPDISELPIVWNKQFLGSRRYSGKGNDIPALSCNGDYNDAVSGHQASADPGTGYLIGSIFVHPGCTFYGFHDYNYQGSYTEWTGPLFISNVPKWTFDHSCGVACARSYLVDCRQQYPDCQPEDSWKTVTSLDNTQSDLPATFTYKYTIGTSWSHQMSESMDISTTISEEVKAGFFDIFEASIGVSVTTGYNWSETSTAAKSETKEISDVIEVPGGRVLEIQQTKGFCGGSEVSTEMFRNVATFKDGSQIIETINM